MLKAAAIFVMLMTTAAQAQQQPQRVTFPSNDGVTTLTGYLYLPAPHARAPAVVMMHGRAGAYSSLAHGVYDANTLSKRHKAWGELWASQGYVALMVDGFAPRGYPAGFPRGSYENRPAVLDEVTVRPLDAYGALVFLRARPDVDGAHVGLQGWSNGGSATLAAMAAQQPGGGFAAGIAFYPACGLKGQFEGGYVPYATVRVFMGSADEEVSPKRCENLVGGSRMNGGDITITMYPGATHSFDDPGAKRQQVQANATATQDAVAKATSFFAERLRGQPARR